MVFALAFVLELPWDLRVPDDYLTPVWQTFGQQDARRTSADLPSDVGAPPTPDHELTCWIRVRTVKVTSQRPLAAADLAYGRLDADETNAWRRSRRALVARLIMARPFRTKRTVAVVYTPVADQDELSREVLSTRLVFALTNLNACLISLGVMLDNRLRPMTMGDLPPAIPVLPAVVEAGRVRHHPSTLLALRDELNRVRTYDSGELDQAQRMLAVVTSGTALAGFYELVQRAGSARCAYRAREAVIDYATAGELFITAMVEAVGERRGVDAAKLHNILRGSFRDRVVHLCRLLETRPTPRIQNQSSSSGGCTATSSVTRSSIAAPIAMRCLLSWQGSDSFSSSSRSARSCATTRASEASRPRSSGLAGSMRPVMRTIPCPILCPRPDRLRRDTSGDWRLTT